MQRRKTDAEGVRPSDVTQFMSEFETAHGLQVKFVWILSTLPATRGKLELHCIASKPAIGGNGDVVDSQFMTWPTVSHKTITGLMYYLLMRLDQTVEASTALARLPGV